MPDIHKIFKYPIEATDKSVLRLPAGARILSVINQGGEIVLYAMVPYPTDFPEVYTEYDIRVVGTGHDIEFSTSDGLDFQFIGTVPLYKGTLIFHIFYRKGNLIAPEDI
jgi:hypothetical protein